MFTGLIETTGIIHKITEQKDGKEFVITAEFDEDDVKTGDSVAVNGTCLTVTAKNGKDQTFYASFQTLKLTNLGDLTESSSVNLERAMLASTRMGGHLVSGHVDTTGEIKSVETLDDGVYRIMAGFPPQYRKYLVTRGSITVDGISLTIVSVDDNAFELVLIPETLHKTCAVNWKKGSRINLEFDMMIRYIENLQKYST